MHEQQTALRDEKQTHKTKKGTFVPFFVFRFGAGNETRTRDPDLGKVVLYQLSYSRIVKLLP
ncbi:unnamed protein product, partial [marine sediment metagenome]